MLRICKEENVLKKYFEEEEVSEGMFTCMTEEYALQRCLESERQEGLEEGLRQGLQKGLQKGLQEGIDILVQTLRELGKSEQEIEKIVAEKCNKVNEEAEPYILSTTKNEEATQ